MWASILTKLVQAFIFPLIDKLWDMFNDYLERQKSKKKDSEAAEKARAEMAKAETAEAVDKAADETLSGI